MSYSYSFGQSNLSICLPFHQGKFCAEFQVCLEEVVCFDEWIKTQVPHSFIDFMRMQASCPGTRAFWGSKAFLLLLQVFLVNCCFLKGRLDLFCVLWQYVFVLYRQTILWSSYGFTESHRNITKVLTAASDKSDSQPSSSLEVTGSQTSCGNFFLLLDLLSCPVFFFSVRRWI